MKKLFLLIISLVLLLVVGCEETIILPNLEGMSREEITTIMQEYQIDYEFKIAYTIIMDFLPFVNYSKPAGEVWIDQRKLKINPVILQLFSKEKRII